MRWLFTAAALSSECSSISHFQGVNGICPRAVRMRGTVRGLMGDQRGRHVKDVLVVDDERSLRLLCRVNLELDGHTVREAATVAEARREIELATPDVILLDIHVGADDGLELLDEIASLELSTRVVLLSGTSEVGPELRARVDSVLGKPFELAKLAAAVTGTLVR